MWQMKGWVALNLTSFHFPVWFTITETQSWSLLMLLQKRKEELLWSDHDQGSLNSPIHTSFFAIFLTFWFSEESLILTRSVWKVWQYSWASLQVFVTSIRIYFVLVVATNKRQSKDSDVDANIRLQYVAILHFYNRLQRFMKLEHYHVCYKNSGNVS